MQVRSAAPWRPPQAANVGALATAGVTLSAWRTVVLMLAARDPARFVRSAAHIQPLARLAFEPLQRLVKPLHPGIACRGREGTCRMFSMHGRIVCATCWKGNRAGSRQAGSLAGRVVWLA